MLLFGLFLSCFILGMFYLMFSSAFSSLFPSRDTRRVRKSTKKHKHTTPHPDHPVKHYPNIPSGASYSAKPPPIYCKDCRYQPSLIKSMCDKKRKYPNKELSSVYGKRMWSYQYTRPAKDNKNHDCQDYKRKWYLCFKG